MHFYQMDLVLVMIIMRSLLQSQSLLYLTFFHNQSSDIEFYSDESRSNVFEVSQLYI